MQRLGEQWNEPNPDPATAPDRPSERHRDRVSGNLPMSGVEGTSLTSFTSFTSLTSCHCEQSEATPPSPIFPP